MKKYLSIFLAFLMVFSLMPLNASAEKVQEKTTNIEIVEEPSQELSQLREKYRLLVDENGRLRIEIRDLKGKLNPGQARKIPVLMYHHVIEEKDIEKYGWKNNTSVLSVEAFEEQMAYLHENDFYVASIDELEMFLDNKLDLPEKTVVLTFDDGYLSNAKYAYPILQKYNFRATIFMIGYRVDAPQIGFDPSDTQALSVAEISKYTDVFDFQSHTYKMHDFGPNKEPLLVTSSEEAVKKDLLVNKALVNAKYLAYPYGRYNDKVVRLAKETGHRLGFTINKGYVSRDSHKFRLSRNGIGPSVTMDQFKDLVNLRSVIQ